MRAGVWEACRGFGGRLLGDAMGGYVYGHAIGVVMVAARRVDGALHLEGLFGPPGRITRVLRNPAVVGGLALAVQRLLLPVMSLRNVLGRGVVVQDLYGNGVVETGAMGGKSADTVRNLLRTCDCAALIVD